MQKIGTTAVILSLIFSSCSLNLDYHSALSHKLKACFPLKKIETKLKSIFKGEKLNNSYIQILFDLANERLSEENVSRTKLRGCIQKIENYMATKEFKKQGSRDQKFLQDLLDFLNEVLEALSFF